LWQAFREDTDGSIHGLRQQSSNMHSLQQKIVEFRNNNLVRRGKNIGSDTFEHFKPELHTLKEQGYTHEEIVVEIRRHPDAEKMNFAPT
jgi:hypothetical protein